MPTKNCGKIVALIIVIVAILVGGYVFAKKAGYLPENGKSYIVQSLLGGDKDEHGCIGSAGYSWCEAKQKCLRVWEEKCEISAIDVSDWEKYTNDEFGFEFSYPKTYELKASRSPVQNQKAVSFSLVKSSADPVLLFSISGFPEKHPVDQAWEVPTDRLIFRNLGKSDGYTFFAFSPDGYLVDKNGVKQMEEIVSTFKFTK